MLDVDFKSHYTVQHVDTGRLLYDLTFVYSLKDHVNVFIVPDTHKAPRAAAGKWNWLKMLFITYVLLAISLCVLYQVGASDLLSGSNQEWLHIDDGVIWIYSSFWEHRIRDGEYSEVNMGPGPYVRILMIGPYNDEFPSVLKQSKVEYFYEELSAQQIESEIVGVYVPKVDDIYPENLSRPYIVYVKAPPDLDKRSPKALAFIVPGFDRKSWSKDMSGSARKWLIPIKGDPYVMHAPHNPEKKIMACVKPVHGGPFSDIPGLINFLVVHSALGMQHLVIYDAGDGSPKFYSVLNSARESGISVEVRNWNLREHHGWMLTQTIHGEACMHDAMMLGYENVITLDLDETLVPHKALGGHASPSYSDLLRDLDAAHPAAAFYRFSNVFYLPGHAARGADDVVVLGLAVTKHLSPTPQGSRTKCIYKPHRMSQVYTHFGVPLNSSFSEVVVPPDVACIHHFRRHSPPGGYHKSEIFEDTTLRTLYGEAITSSKPYKAFEEKLKSDPLHVHNYK